MRYRHERRSSCGFRIGASFVLAAFAIAAAACGMPIGPLQARATDTWTRSYQLSKSGEISISNVNGRIEIEGVDGSTVDISAERMARGASDRLASDLLKRIVISDRSTPDSVSVQTERVEGILIGASFEVRYHVKAPKTTTIHASTVNGGVEVTGVAGRLIARTTNGGIVGKGITGGVEARVVNGGIRIQLAAVGKDEVVMTTVNGGVRVALPEKAKATVSANWVNGGLRRSGFDFEIRDSSRRHFEGLLNGGGTPITLSTVNGGISIAPGLEDSTQDQKDAPRVEKLAE